MYLKISRQGLTGARELRKRVRPNGAAAFSAPAERGTRTALACSPLTGGKFSAEPQRGIRRLRTAGTCRAPRRGKRVDTKVSTLLTPTSFYFLVWRRPETGDRFENRERQRFFSTVGEHSVLPFLYIFAVSDTVLLHIWFTLRRARHSSAAQLFNVLYRTAPTD